MKTPLKAGEAVLMRIFLGSRDQYEGKPLHEAIVLAARAAGLSGATVFEGFAGYGANSVVHHAEVWRLSQDLPIVIEIVDSEAALRAFLPPLEAMLAGGGLITMEKVTVLRPDGAGSP